MTHPLPSAALDDRLGWADDSFRSLLIRDRDALIEPSKTDCSYAAGFFDGEGNINISSTSRADCAGPCYALSVGAAQNVIEPLLFIQNRWGGSIFRRAALPPRKGHFVWGCHANLACDFLLDLLPHLTVKSERAKLALRFQAIKSGGRRKAGAADRRVQLAPIYAEMKELNGYRLHEVMGG